MAKTKARNHDTTANLGFEAKLWAAVDVLRNNMDAAEYKHVVLGLIFLKCISDAFEAKHAELQAQRAEGADPEDPDEYRAVKTSWVREETYWQLLKASALQPACSRLVAGGLVSGRQHERHRQLQTLAVLRDALLANRAPGELQAKDAERFVRAAK